jgi:hypothetical protein
LYESNARDSGGRVPTKRFGWIAKFLQAAAKNGTVFYGHGAASCHVGTHGVACIAQKNDMVAAPPIVAFTIKDWPHTDVVCYLQNALQIFMKICEISHQ